MTTHSYRDLRHMGCGEIWLSPGEVSTPRCTGQTMSFIMKDSLIVNQAIGLRTISTMSLIVSL